MEEKKILKGFTWKSVLVGVVVVAVVSFLTRGQGDSTFFSKTNTYHIVPGIEHRIYQEWAGHVFIWSLAFLALTMFGIALVNKFRPGTFSIQECTVIAIMVPLGSYWGQHIDFGINIITAVPGLAYRPLSYLQTQLPYFEMAAMGQTLDVSYWKSILFTSNLGGVNWLMHLPIMAWDVIFIVSQGFLMLFIMLLYRRVAIYVEALPFPTVQIVNQLVEVAQPAEGSKRIARKWFLIGLIIALAYLMPLFTIDRFMAVAWGPGKVWPGYGGGYVAGVNLYAYVNLIGLAILSWVPLYFSFAPFEIGWFTLMPIDTLISIVVTWVAVWLILPSYLTSTGYWPKMGPGQHVRAVNWRIHGAYGSSVNGETLTCAMMGMLVAMAIIPIWKNRAAFIPILKSITGKDPSREIDPNPPIPYKFVWLGIVVCGLGWVWAGSATGIPYIIMLIYVPVMAVLTTGLMFMFAETGGWLGIATCRQNNYWHGYIGSKLTYAFIDMTTMNPAYVATFRTFTWDHFASGFPAFAMLYSWYTQHSFKLSEVTNTDNKDTVKSLLLALLVAAVAGAISVFFFLGLLPLPPTYTSGWRATSGEYGAAQLAVFNREAYNAERFMTNTFNYVLMAIGFVLPFIITIGRARFSWFRVTSAGVLFGLIWGHAALGPMIVGLVLKYLVLKVGGTKMYNERLMPICVGLIVAGGITHLVANTLTWLYTWIWRIPWVA